MVAVQRLNFRVLLFIHLHLLWSQSAFSQNYLIFYDKPVNSTAGLSTLWMNRPVDFSGDMMEPILQRGNAATQFFCGFYCKGHVPDCFLGILLFYNSSESVKGWFISARLVWSANRNHPVKTNATLRLGQDGNLVLADSDGTLVWSTNTTGKSVSGLNMTEMGNLVLFDKNNRTIWQSFDHPTDSLLPGQKLISEQKLIASVSASNISQGLFSLAIINGSLTTYIKSDPPQYYYASEFYYPYNRYLRIDGQTITTLRYPPGPTAQFMRLEPDGHLRVYKWDTTDWIEVDDLFSPDLKNCEYPMVCGKYSICTNGGQCTCPAEGNFFRPSNDRKPDLGCQELTSISCDSPQHHSFLELKNTTYFAFDFNHAIFSRIFWVGGKKLEDCKRACLRNCSCKAVVFRYDQDSSRRGRCLLLNEVFSLVDKEDEVDTTVFLKVQNSSMSEIKHSPVISPNSPKQKTKSFKVIIGSTFAALFGIILVLSASSLVYRRSIGSSKDVDFQDLEPILPGILTRFSYNELKKITQDFSRKLGKGGFGSVYEGTLSSGTKIAVKHLDGVGQVKESFLTEVKTVGGIHHINLVKLIGYCAEKSHRLLIYEYMVNGSLDRWITQENGLTWNTRKMVISDIAKGLAYLHEDCSHKIIHLDIKPQNILLDQNFNAKLSDFGLSKLIEKDKSKVVTRMRGTPGYLAPEWLSSVITEKVDVYAFGIVLLEILCGRTNLDWSQTDEEDVHLLTVFTRKAEQEQLTDMVDRNEDMQLHREAVIAMMSLAAWCLQGDFSKRPSMSLVVKALEGLVTVETNLDYNFRNVPKVGAGNQPREATISSKLPSVLSGPR